jgi:hypothetical protein
MDVNNGTTTPSDTRVTSAGGSGMGDPKTQEALEWTAIQPGETVHFDVQGIGPWKVEFRVMRQGRRRTYVEFARTPQDLVELIDDGDDLSVRVTRPRRAANG